jgi:hypothetical protein
MSWRMSWEVFKHSGVEQVEILGARGVNKALGAICKFSMNEIKRKKNDWIKQSCYLYFCDSQKWITIFETFISKMVNNSDDAKRNRISLHLF